MAHHCVPLINDFGARITSVSVVRSEPRLSRGQAMQRVADELRQTLPPVFAGTSLNELTGGAIHWPTIQNRRALRQIPDDCFVRSGPRVLVIRDRFLDWWQT